ncbi:MAG: hypothetical protein KKE73_14705 [Proteobacteria bacterium]|nr:hypothetical protein [Pseudomonadota bacterium]
MHDAGDQNLDDYYRDFNSGQDVLIIDDAETNWAAGTDVTLGSNFFQSAYSHDEYVANGGNWSDVSYTSGDYPLILDAEGNLYYDENPDGGNDTAECIGHFTGGLPGETSIKVATIHIDDNADHMMEGSEAFDFMIGLGGDDTLWGMAESDTLFGGTGADTFKYMALADGGVGGTAGDEIIDFHHGEDHFAFNSGVFTVCDTVLGGDDTHPKNNLGFWDWGSLAYEYGSDGGGTYGDSGFIFDTNGDLWYDPNLGDVNDAVHIAHVEGEVTYDDINLVV